MERKRFFFRGSKVLSSAAMQMASWPLLGVVAWTLSSAEEKELLEAGSWSWGMLGGLAVDTDVHTVHNRPVRFTSIFIYIYTC